MNNRLTFGARALAFGLSVNTYYNALAIAAGGYHSLAIQRGFAPAQVALQTENNVSPAPTPLPG